MLQTGPHQTRRVVHPVVRTPLQPEAAEEQQPLAQQPSPQSRQLRYCLFGCPTLTSDLNIAQPQDRSLTVAYIYLLLPHSGFAIKLQLHQRLQLLGDLRANSRAFSKQRILFKGFAMHFTKGLKAHKRAPAARFHPVVLFELYSKNLLSHRLRQAFMRKTASG